MSQIQIRQVPVATSTDAQRIVGSWFPSGYYGHFRATSRADLCNYFRQLARPNPPTKFLDRQHAEATTHRFSRHDNRFKFECDPLVRGTQEGFGKRKSETNSRGEFDPLFVSWVPKNVDRKAFVDDVKVTSYADDYNRESTPSHMLSDIQSKPSSINNDSNKSLPSSSPPEISVYASIYKHGQPDNYQSKQIRRETFQRFLTTRTRLVQQQSNERSASVASCLVWNNVHDNSKLPVSNDKTINIVVPITLQARIIPNTNNNISPRQRAQSAGPRLISTMPEQQKPYQSQSMQMFKKTTETTERPHTATTTSRDHYKGANFGLKIAPPPRAVTSFEQTHTNISALLLFRCNPKIDCGCSKESAVTPKIIGGEPVKSKSFPWAVSVRNQNSHICGGSVIIESLIITGAHCLSTISLLKDIIIIAGINLLTDNGQTRSILRIYKHPNFDLTRMTNDIAVLLLSSPLDFTDSNVSRICLPTVNDNPTASNELHQVTIQVFDNNAPECRPVLRDAAVQFCAGVSSGGKDVCYGDSGGPLMAFINNHWLVMGISSASSGCARASYATIFTRVIVFNDYIQSIINSE